MLAQNHGANEQEGVVVVVVVVLVGVGGHVAWIHQINSHCFEVHCLQDAVVDPEGRAQGLPRFLKRHRESCGSRATSCTRYEYLQTFHLCCVLCRVGTLIVARETLTSTTDPRGGSLNPQKFHAFIRFSCPCRPRPPPPRTTRVQVCTSLETCFVVSDKRKESKIL